MRINMRTCGFNLTSVKTICTYEILYELYFLANPILKKVITQQMLYVS